MQHGYHKKCSRGQSYDMNNIERKKYIWCLSTSVLLLTF